MVSPDGEIHSVNTIALALKNGATIRMFGADLTGKLGPAYEGRTVTVARQGKIEIGRGRTLTRYVVVIHPAPMPPA